MNSPGTLKRAIHRLRCARKRRQVIADLGSLSDLQLQDIGMWRGVIPAVTDDLVARQGCPADDV